MKIKGLIFDLGGTLIEYAGPYDRWPELETPGLQVAYNTLQAHGFNMPDFERYRLSAFEILPERWQMATSGERNLRLVDFLTEVMALNRVDNIPNAILVEAGELYQQAICSQATIVEGARETLALMQDRGYKIGLLSNTMFTGEAHIADLRRFELETYFDAMVFSADAGKWKPSPEPYLDLLSSMDIDADQAVFIGDDPYNDILGGRRAGLKTIHLKSSDRFGAADGVHPHAVINDLAGLPPVLDAWAQRD